MRESDLNKEVTAMGWAQSKRDMGGVIFVDLRDREGTLQVVFDAQKLSKEDFALAESIKNESVIAVSGTIRVRDEETYNPRLKTGTIELAAHSVEILSMAQPLPFLLEEADKVREDLRLKYRYLDLRRPKLYEALRFRARVVRVVSDYLENEGFLAVETPMLTKSTPEGARDYLVPSRVHPGSFYALPQSPQIFKQLLMVGGVDRYYQVARCFRDEDLRADRQPEFTQVDMEMSFVEQEDILQHLEKMFKHLMFQVKGIEIKEPFLRLTWKEAMDRYGSDKPDLRFGLPIIDLTELMKQCSFSVFRRVADKGGVIRAINVKGCGDFSRSTIEALTDKAQSLGAKGMAWIAMREDGTPYSILNKYFNEEEYAALLRAVDAKPNDFILFCADKLSTVRRVLGGLRVELGKLLHLTRKDDYCFLFVTDFPEFEYSEEEGRFLATHHPFTMPYPEDIPYLLSDPGRVRAQAYDVVLNGVELGSGSMRIHQQDVQQRMFEALGFSPEQIEERFGFMVHAFSYGTPPHGGFAFGLDRVVMLLLGADSLRDVIAFPKIKDASCLLTEAPNTVDEEQLKVLGLTPENLTDYDHKAAKRKKRRSSIDVDRVANLSKLRLSAEEKAQMATQMAEIVAFADELSKIDTEGIDETAHIVPVSNVFREDEVLSSFSREALLSGAPQQQDGYIFVPQVVKTGEENAEKGRSQQ